MTHPPFAHAAFRSTLRLLLGACVALALPACDPELGECDMGAATSPIYYDPSGYPAYPGQALMDVSCGAGTFCHAEGIAPEDRFGAPAGLDFDLAPPFTEDDVARLERAHRRVRGMRRSIYGQVLSGAMPPPGPDAMEALAEGVEYVAGYGTPGQRTLPVIGTPEAEEILRNWLACDAPVVSAFEGSAPGFGDVVGLGEPREECSEGQTDCGAGCIDTMASAANCGACGVACATDEVCFMGECATGCGAPLSACDGACVDTSTDPMNCGACGAVCGPGATCSGGACGCGGGTVDCAGDGTCVDTNTDPAHCGGCDVSCSVGEGCTGGTCVGCGMEVSFAQVEDIFEGNCATSRCHSGARPRGDLDLTAGRAWASLVNVPASCGSNPLVAPGDVEGSYLWHKLTRSAMELCSGDQMPKQGESLPSDDLEIIRAWICAGALDE